MNIIIQRSNAESSTVGKDFLDRLMDDVLWSIENPSMPGAIDYVRDASDAEREEAKPIVEHMLWALNPTGVSGYPAVFDGDRARLSPEYAKRATTIAPMGLFTRTSKKNLLPDDAYAPHPVTGRVMSQTERADLDERIQKQLRMTPLPTEPGIYRDGTGDRWVLDASGGWTDHLGAHRDVRYAPLLALFIEKSGPFVPLDESQQTRSSSDCGVAEYPDSAK